MSVAEIDHEQSLDIAQLAGVEIPSKVLIDYCNTQDAQLYFDRLVFTDDWDSAPADVRLLALSEATDLIRVLAVPHYDDYADVPEDIKVATADIALKLLEGYDMDIEQREAVLDSQAHGNLRMVNANEDTPLHLVAGIPSIPAWEILTGYLDIPNTISLDRK